MPNKQDTEVLESLRARKSSHVRRAVQKFHDAFEATVAIGVSSSADNSTQRRTHKASASTNSSVKRRIEQLERKIIEQSETTGNKSLLLLSPLPPRSHQRITVSPRFAFSPKQLYQKTGWDNDDDTTVSTVSISSMSMSSSLSVDRPLEIRFERSCLKERPTTKLFGSPSRSDAIGQIDHVSIFDFSCDGSVSISSDMQTLPTSSQDCPSSKSSSSIKVEDPEKGSFNYYFIFSVFLLSAKGAVDPVVICTIYLLLEICRKHSSCEEQSS